MSTDKKKTVWKYEIGFEGSGPSSPLIRKDMRRPEDVIDAFKDFDAYSDTRDEEETFIVRKVKA
jgi:hypothetical protein